MEYALPQSVDEALAILNSESNATVFAGATDLIPQLRGGRPEPGLIVDLKKIPGLVDLSFSLFLILATGVAAPIFHVPFEKLRFIKLGIFFRSTSNRGSALPPLS